MPQLQVFISCNNKNISSSTLDWKGVKTLRTQNTYGPGTFRHHQTGAEVSRQFVASRTLRHCYRTVLTSSKHYCYNRKEGLILLVIIKEDNRFYGYTQECIAEE